MFQIATLSNQAVDDAIPDISFKTTTIFTFVIITGLCQSVGVFGVVTNIINIMCFVKQGFNEAINISLLGLAISDLCSLITLIWSCISYTLVFGEVEMPFDVLGVFYLVGGNPYLTFTRVTSWITALITLERCLCVIAPLKVKNIVTPKRVTAAVVIAYFILISCEAPVYVVNRLDMVFFPHRNKTLLGLVSTSDRENVEKISFGINNFFMSFTAFIVIIICTIILAFSLSKRNEWIKTSTKADDVCKRNRRVAKMVVMISALFISCFTPVTIIMLALAFGSELKVGGKYINTAIVVGGAGIVLESINSSVNIFIYYHMSSKYRLAFHMFCKSKAMK